VTDIETVVGPAHVMHRLAVGVELIDAVRRRRVEQPLPVGREVDPRLGGSVSWPCLGLEPSGSGRYRLGRSRALPARIRVRVDDPARRFAPRRFDLTLWSPEETDGIDRTPPVGTFAPVLSRVLRAWLPPGPAALPPGGTTLVRGRVVRVVDGRRVPARWARVRARAGPADTTVGWAHADERGEFVLVVTGTGTVPPADSTLDVRLAVTAPAQPARPPFPPDRLADLVVEPVPRSAAPPAPGDLDNELLRGLADPPGYRTSSAGTTTKTIPVGGESTIADIEFTD
jgi:hypothetical protein